MSLGPTAGLQRPCRLRTLPTHAPPSFGASRPSDAAPRAPERNRSPETQPSTHDSPVDSVHRPARRVATTRPLPTAPAHGQLRLLDANVSGRTCHGAAGSMTVSIGGPSNSRPAAR